MSDRASRRAALRAALGFLEIRWTGGTPPAAAALARWLGSWNGMGLIAAGMQREALDLELKQYPGAWRANFYPSGIAHSIVRGSAWEPTPWRAVQRAAWIALRTEEASAAPPRSAQ